MQELFSAEQMKKRRTISEMLHRSMLQHATGMYIIQNR